MRNTNYIDVSFFFFLFYQINIICANKHSKNGGINNAFREMFAHAKVSPSLFQLFASSLSLLTGSINVIATFLPTFDIADVYAFYQNLFTRRQQMAR